MYLALYTANWGHVLKQLFDLPLLMIVNSF